MNASQTIVSRTLIAVSFFALVHFGFGFILGLSVDEAHYALYATHPDWSYFDHPPLVGWIQILPTMLNAPDGIIRLIPETLWTLGIWISCCNAKKILQLLGNPSNAINPISAQCWTALTLLGSAILHVLSVGLLPDTLLLPLVAAMIYQSLSMIDQYKSHQTIQIRSWLLLGLILGLSALSKYTSIFFALAIPICLISITSIRVFLSAGFVLGMLMAAACIIPIFYWNANHEWISFIYQLKHGSGGEWKLKRVLLFFINQILCYGALPLLGLYVTLKYKLINNKSILLFFLIPFCIFAYMSGGGGSLPHWTSPAWLALSPISGIGITFIWNIGQRKLTRLFISIQFLIISLGFILLFTGGIPWIDKTHPLGQKNPIADLYGWSNAGIRAVNLSKKFNTTSITVQNWTLASRIGWYGRPYPIYVLDDRFDQFDLWFGNIPNHETSLLINWSQMPYDPPVGENQFEKCELVDQLPVERLNRTIAQFDFYLCTNWRGKSPS